MAKGHSCPKCGYHMFAVSEKYDSAYKVNIVDYECLNNQCKHRITVKEWD